MPACEASEGCAAALALVTVAVIIGGCSGSSETTTADASAPTPTALPAATPTPGATVAPTPTISPTPAPPDIASVCAALSGQPYETRKAAVSEVDDRAPIASACGAALATLEDAMAVEAATSSIRDRDITDLDESLSCSPTRFEWVATNSLDLAVGVYMTAELTRPGEEGEDDETLGSIDPQIAWRIEPGASATLAGSFPDHTEAFPNCSITGHLFLADGADLPGDAATPGTEIPDGLDATLWIDEVIDRGDEFRASADPLLVARYEDLRSFDYHDLVTIDRTEAPSLLVEDSSDIATCRIFGWPDENHVAMIYERSIRGRVFERDGEISEIDDDQYLAIGVFRRGQDGGWRWLGPALTLDLGDITDCRALVDT